MDWKGEGMSDAKKYSIYEAIPLMTGAIAPISKNRQGAGMPFKFRGIDDVYAHLNLLLERFGVSILPEILDSKHEQAGASSKGTVMYRHTQRVRFHLVASDGTEVTADAEGEGMDNSDKATPKAASTAYKSMAFQVFCIPTGEKIDSEEESPEVEAQKPPASNGTSGPSNGHAQKAPAGNGAAAVTQATAFAATADAITSAGSAGDLAVISERLPKIDLTEGQRRILKARLDARLKQVGGAQA